ncbi:PREDICTED: ankyrin-1-like [Amphimedon queenslandica]|uniref:Death domain-containing protein n=1 Tax=Amphimedon queenslandica TaxID=400682 RepID=A0A1X7UZG6_AMPQE|nr:PREDICTED: ankyrin-1-like [Amphimedon queenslandica]|eukprot:XP_011403628.1 PREDICTED: ankyrin-1-like [Amphimedon queenslandica]
MSIDLSTLHHYYRSDYELESPERLGLQHLIPMVDGLVEWHRFGTLLNVPQNVLRKLEEEHPRNIDRRVTEILRYWLENDADPKYYEVLDALEKIPNERYLVKDFIAKIRSKVQFPKPPLKEISITHQEKLADSLKEMQKKFARFVTKIQEALENLGNFQKIYRFVVNYLQDTFTPRRDPENIIQLFISLQGHYCFMNYEILKEIACEFVEKDLKESMHEYKKALNKWQKSTTVREFKVAMEKAAKPAIDDPSPDQCLECLVMLKLEGEWLKITIENLQRLLKYLFGGKRSIFTRIKIIEGSVIVRALAPKSEMLSLLCKSSRKCKELLYLGVLSIQVGSLYFEALPVFPCLSFTFELGLCEAINKHCNLDLIRFLLDIGTKINAEGLAGLTPLMMAASYNNVAAISLLAEYKADLELFSESHPPSSAIHFAIVDGRKEAAEILLDLGVPPNLHNPIIGITPLMAVAMTNQEEIFAVLMDRYQDRVMIDFQDINGFTALLYACQHGYTFIVERLLKAKANTNLKVKNGLTALHLACYLGHQELVKQLLNCNADPNISLQDGTTPLITATYYKYYKIVKLLLQSSALVDTQTDSTTGQATALLIASVDDDVQMMFLLLNAKANVNIKDAAGMTPMHKACFNGNKEMVQRLLENGANPNLCTLTGDTPLHTAFCGKINAEIIRLILAAGANPNAVEKTYKLTPLHLACCMNEIAIIETLLSADKININVLDVNGRTPLSFASSLGHSKAVEILLKAGANTELGENICGWTPIFFAAAVGHLETLTLLLEHGAILKEDNDGRTPQAIAEQTGHLEAHKILSKGYVAQEYKKVVTLAPLKSVQPLELIESYCKSILSQVKSLRNIFSNFFKQFEHFAGSKVTAGAVQ